MTFSQLLMVKVGALKLFFMFVYPDVRVDRAYCFDLLMSQQLMRIICQVPECLLFNKTVL